MSAKIIVILGSQSDREIVKGSKLPEFLDKVVGNQWELSIISAHRNSEILQKYCADKLEKGARVFIGVAGMAAALPGVISAHCMGQIPVLGVALASGECPDAMDALLSMVRMPPGVPVACCGIGKAGLLNAAIIACSIMEAISPSSEQRFFVAWNGFKTEPQLDVKL